MIGSRIGSKSRFTGSIVGSVGDDEGSTDPFAGIDRDATSNIYLPADSAQWTQLRTAAGLSMANPDSLWLCQEAAGNLADSIGALTLTAIGAPLYQQAAAGWTRKAVSVSADGAADRFAATAGVGPSPATTSQLWLILGTMPATPAGTRFFLGLNLTGGLSNHRLGHLLASGFPRSQVNGVNVDGSNSISNELQACAVKLNNTASEAKSYTLDEKLTNAFVAVADGTKGFGNGSLIKVVYAAMWSGAAAEVADADFKALLQAMGFTVAWS